MNGARESLAYVALGSNLGDRRAALDSAVRELARFPGVRVLRTSTWIETEPVGGPRDQPRFLNGVVELRTSLDALQLLRVLQDLESRAGRDRTREVRNGPRTLDLDLIVFGELCVATSELELPHPRAGEREFVLAPLAELAPELAAKLRAECAARTAPR